MTDIIVNSVLILYDEGKMVLIHVLYINSDDKQVHDQLYLKQRIIGGVLRFLDYKTFKLKTEFGILSEIIHKNKHVLGRLIQRLIFNVITQKYVTHNSQSNNKTSWKIWNLSRFK